MAIPPQQLVSRLDTLPGLFMHQLSDAQRRAMWGELVNAGNNSGVAEKHGKRTHNAQCYISSDWCPGSRGIIPSHCFDALKFTRPSEPGAATSLSTSRSYHGRTLGTCFAFWH